MKKTFLILALVLMVFAVTGCTKTDVENELNEQNENQELLTDEEAAALENENQEFQEDYLRELAEATDEQRQNELIGLIDDIENAKTNKKAGKAKGSCEAIAESSTCVEYYGSFWNEVSMRSQCEGAGNFSFDACPSDMAGGCNTGVGTQADMVAWMYLRGGGEITNESLKYAKMACDATLASEWINMK
jgi:hypothetical protein